MKSAQYLTILNHKKIPNWIWLEHDFRFMQIFETPEYDPLKTEEQNRSISHTAWNSVKDVD